MNWNDLRFLLAISRGGTLSSAARQLAVDQATVSRRLKALEAALQVRLLVRLPHETRLTDVGERILQRVADIDERAAEIERLALVAGDKARAGITVSAPPVLARYLLVPALARLSAGLGRPRITVFSEAHLASLARMEADLAIRLTPGVDEAEIVTKVGSMAFGLYAAPAYANIDRPDEWEFIGYTSRQGDFEHKRWLYRIIGRRPVICEVADLGGQYDAACSGIGVAGLPCFIADRDEGLVKLPTEDPMLQLHIWLARHADRRNDQLVRETMAAITGLLRENHLA